MTTYRERRRQYLDALFRTVEDFKGEVEISSSLARYLCVLVAGYIETSLREIFMDYVQRTSSLNTANFVSARLEYMRSPFLENVLDLIRSFSENWHKAVKDAIRKAELGDYLDSIARDRNEIAHGAELDITYRQIAIYYQKAQEAVRIIETECC